MKRGLFLILMGRAQARVWDVGKNYPIEAKKPMPYVNHYSFPILDADGGHITIQISGHPPFPAQVIVNGHESVADQGVKAGIHFIKEGNCFTDISDAAGLAKIADTLSEESAIGRLSQACALDLLDMPMLRIGSGGAGAERVAIPILELPNRV